MTTPTPLPLDEAANEHRDPALAECVRAAMRNLQHVERELARDRASMWRELWEEDEELVKLRARVAELEQRERDLMGQLDIETHEGMKHADRVAELEQQRDTAVLASELAHARYEVPQVGAKCIHRGQFIDFSDVCHFCRADRAEAHANALRDALEKALRWFDPRDAYGNAVNSEDMSADIAAALASTPAASLAAHDAEVLERAAKVAEHHANPEPRMSGATFYRNPSALVIARDIRALAAQAQEVKQ